MNANYAGSLNGAFNLQVYSLPLLLRTPTHAVLTLWFQSDLHIADALMNSN